MLKAELPAGGVDISPLAFPEGGGNTGFLQDPDELMLASLVGLDVGEQGDAIHGNQVDVGTAMAEMFREFAGVFGSIVEAAQEDVLIGDTASADFEILVRGSKKLRDADGLIDGDQLIAERVVGGVEGDRQIEGLINAGEFANFFREPDRGDRDAAGTEAKAAFLRHMIERREEVGEVREGFADAHDNDVRNPLF